MRSGSSSGYAGGRGLSSGQSFRSPRAERDDRSRSLGRGGRDRISEITRLIDELDGQLSAIERRTRLAAQPIREPRIERNLPPLPPQEPPREPAADSRLSRIEAQLAEIAARLDSPKPAPDRAADTSRLRPSELAAEIADRQREIDSQASRAAAPPPAPPGPSIADLRGELDQLNERIAGELRMLAESHRDSQHEIADRIETLRRERHGSEGALDALRDEFAFLRNTIDATARETSINSIEAGFHHLVERLDDLTRRVPDEDRFERLSEELQAIRGAVSLQAVETRGVGRIEDELQDIRNALAAALMRPDPSRDGIERLEAQLAGLRAAVDAIGRRALDEEARAHALEGHLEEWLDTRIRRDALDPIEERLALIAERLDSLRPDPAEHRFETLHAELADLKRELVRRDATAPLSAIEAQIAGLAERMDRLQPDALEDRLATIAERLDNLRSSPADRNIEILRSEIAGLKQEIGRQDISPIEMQIAEMASRLDAATTSRDDSRLVANLEERITALAEELSHDGPSREALADVERNLARIETLLGEAREETVAAARDTAREAVERFAASMPRNEDNGLVRALKEDMRSLQKAATDADSRNQATLEAVHGTLAKVVERLARLEVETTAPAAPAIAASAEPARARPEDNRPLEPGSGKPLIGEERTARTADRKADFIAAARRAAQAAQAESAALRAMPPEEPEEAEKPGALARIGRALKSRRRPIVLALAAVVLALGAVEFLKNYELPEAGETEIASAEAIDPAPTGSIPAPVREAEPAPVTAKAEAPRANDRMAAISFAPPSGAASTLGAAPAGPPTSGFSGRAPAPAEPAIAAAGPEALQTDAALGDPAAQFEVASRLADGRGTRQDMKLAAQWYERAANNGVAVAQYRLASLYERGDGLPRDPARAKSWYERAAAQGNVMALHNLAVMLSEGAVGKSDYQRIVELFTEAAKHGVKDSQYNLGVLYARGLGVKQDLIESYKWFALAAKQGDADSASRRDDVAKVLTQDQLAKARAAVEAVAILPVDPAANEAPEAKPEWADGVGQRVTSADGSPMIREAQRLLVERGYDPGTADGEAGPKTRDAIRAFQRDSGLAETGRVDPSLLAALGADSI